MIPMPISLAQPIPLPIPTAHVPLTIGLPGVGPVAGGSKENGGAVRQKL